MRTIHSNAGRHTAVGVSWPPSNSSYWTTYPKRRRTGTIFRLRGKGLGGSSRGDAHVKLMVETPAALTDQQKKLFEQLQGSLTDEQTPARAKFVARMKDEGSH